MSDHTPLTRRSVLRTAGIAAGFGLVGTGTASLSEEAHAADVADPSLDTATQWAQFQGNAAKTGVAGGGPSSPAVRWEYGRDRGAVYDQPAITEERVYVPYFDEAESESETDESGIVALTTDGEERWRFRGESNIAIGGPPAVGDGLVFVGGETFRTNDCGEEVSDGALLLAVDAATGEEMYRHTIQGMGAIAPTVADGTVYTVVPAFLQGDGTLVAYETTTGTEQWRASTGPYGMAGFTTPPVSVADGRVYVAEHDAVAFDAATGEELWRTATHNLKGNTSQNAPAVANGTVYVGTGGERGTFYALSADDGSIEWEREAASDVFGSAAVTSDTVYVSMKTIDSPPEGVLALSTEDGSRKWLAEDITKLEDPILGGEYVYVGPHAVTPDDGTVAWSLDGEHAGTAVAGETLYLGGRSVIAVGGE